MYFRKPGLVALDVVRALDWYRELGIPTEGTRLQEIHDFIFHRILRTDTIEAQELEQGVPNMDTFYALNDGHGFGLIAKTLSSDRRIQSHLPRKNLKRVLEGPLKASEEAVGEEADARNIFVELELAAYISASGLRIVGFDDLEFEFEGFRYFVECKRPFNEWSLDHNIESAYKQLRRKLADDRSRGIVAVAVEKVLGLDRSFQHFSSVSEADAFAFGMADEFRAKVAKYERKWVDPRVIGILAIIRFLMKVDDPDAIGSSWMFGLLKLASPAVGQAAENARLDRMVGMLRRALSGDLMSTQNKPTPAAPRAAEWEHALRRAD